MRQNRSERLRRSFVWLGAALALGAILLFGAYDIIALPGCESCHEKRGFGTTSLVSPHAEVDCRSCHVPNDTFGRVAFAMRQPFGMYLPMKKVVSRDVAAVPDSRCVACHQGLAGGPVSRNGLRISHATCAVGAACSDCHSAVAHGDATSWPRTYTMDRCLSCHAPEKQTSCDLCHDGRLAAGRVNSGSFTVTHGPQWRSTHGMGESATCMVCHGPDDCSACHGAGLPHDADFFGGHSTYSLQPDARCSGCHEQSYCDGCHGIPMPHPDDFTQTHATSAEGRALCDRCHAEADCTTCHEMHIHPGGAIGSASGGGS